MAISRINMPNTSAIEKGSSVEGLSCRVLKRIPLPDCSMMPRISAPIATHDVGSKHASVFSTDPIVA